jgi:type III restriction enzyme
MMSTKFRFDSSQPYQLEATAAVVDLFNGQPADATALLTTLRGAIPLGDGSKSTFDLDLVYEIGAVGNNVVVERELIARNMQAIQDRNGLPISAHVLANADLDFEVEMETGTGKTYVYLRTAFELAARYNFTKFIILVPSVAVREGVSTSLRLMRTHFRELYPGLPFDVSVYSGKNAQEVQSFATSTNLQFLIMTIDSVRGDANTRVIHQKRDKLNGLRPIDYLRATCPIVIMDEPQNMESKLSLSAVAELEPACVLRYSATHKVRRNLVYSLDPVDAHDLGLVKQIVVADADQQGPDAKPYVRLVSVKNDPSWTARVEVAVRGADGRTSRRVLNVKRGIDLGSPKVTGNPVYSGMVINEMTIDSESAPASIEISTLGTIVAGESSGGSTQEIYREMIRETIREHLHKESLLRSRGIKVLSLFFVDSVVSYMGDGTTNVDANGDFARWFDELFVEERAAKPAYKDLLPQDPQELRRAYFSQIRRGKVAEFKDTSGTTQADDDAYELIMRDKERLLDQDEPVRFIFSHSALREGWDNPNVFQICTLREIGTEHDRRQTIGRGLRLPVAKTPDGFERISDASIATLTVIANESYQDFARHLQGEYKAAGVEIGRVRPNEFAKILRVSDEGVPTDQPLGTQKSEQIWNHLTEMGLLKDGEPTDKFQPNDPDFSLELPSEFEPYECEIIELISRSRIENIVKAKSKRRSRKLNKELYRSAEFVDFWEKISQRTTYRVTFDRDDLVARCIAGIKDAPPIAPLQIRINRTRVEISRGGPKGTEFGSRSASLQGSYPLPDIVTELQESVAITRRTIIDILLGCGRLSEFIGNPGDFTAMVRRVLNNELAKIVVDGVQYEKLGGSLYELRQLQKDGEEEKDRFIDQLYHVKNQQKTDFDYVVYDSEVERQFAAFLDGRDDVRLFMKLPAGFKIPTPVGPYNPDWAIIKVEEGEERIYMIRETKSTEDFSKLRPTELAKIKSARKHFAAIGVNDYQVATPDKWNL